MYEPKIPAVLVMKEAGEDTFHQHHPVRLHQIPRPGEIIELTSILNIASQQGSHFYRLEVINVEHQIHDIDDRSATSKGAHDIIINVRNLNIV